MTGAWTPLLYRSGDAWIGRMANGELGVGTETEQRAGLARAGMVPMWPFMETALTTFVEDVTPQWGELSTPAFPTIESLIVATIVSAWRSGREYWRAQAQRWLDEVATIPLLDQSALQPLRALSSP